jgi:sulfate transporter 4
MQSVEVLVSQLISCSCSVDFFLHVCYHSHLISFGYEVVRSDVIYEIMINLFEPIAKFNYKTFLLGTAALTVLVAMKNVGTYEPKLKWMKPFGPLTVSLIGIVLVAACNLQNKGIPIVKTIPSGLPKFTASKWFPLENASDLFVTVIGIVIIGFMESVSIAKGLAAKHKYEIDPSAELLGLGMSNLFGGMFQAYPVTGSFSRSAVNNDTGAVSGISGVVTGTIVMFVLLFLTSVFEKLPNAILGAIIISGVIGLFDYPEAIFLWKVNKFDFAVWMFAFLGSLFLGVEIGLAISVGVSLLIVIYESAYPHTAVLGRLPGSAVYRNTKQYPEAETYDGIVICRIDAPLYFANALNAREKIRKYRQKAEDEAAVRNSHVKYIVIDLTPVSHIDTSALHIFSDMVDNYHSRNQQLCFANPSMTVYQSMVIR